MLSHFEGELPSDWSVIQATRSSSTRVSQGDIIRDVEYVEYVEERDGIIEVSKIVYPVAIVLSQDCDLEQDYKFRLSKDETLTHDKYLLSVLMAPLYNAEHVYLGEHLSDLQLQMERINKNKTPGEFLRKNDRPRYHYLEFPQNIPIVPSVIDFKHYFSVNVPLLERLKATSFVCSVSPLFREDIAHRFASFLARIGLPGV